MLIKNKKFSCKKYPLIKLRKKLMSYQYFLCLFIFNKCEVYIIGQQMQVSLKLLFATLITISFVQARVRLSIYSDQSTAFYQCVKQTGFDMVILQVDSDINGIKQSNIQNILNAKSSGL